jgi:type IV pilus biogenesis protein CpaD/CtpE
MVARGVAVLAVALAGLLSACTSQLDLAEPADTAPRAAAQPAQPLAVHDMPAARDTRPMTAAERQRITDELNAARERHLETTGTVPARTPAR